MMGFRPRSGSAQTRLFSNSLRWGFKWVLPDQRPQGNANATWRAGLNARAGSSMTPLPLNHLAG